MEDIKDEQLLLVEVFKSWMRELDAAYLIKEDMITYWDKMPDNEVESDWQFLKMSQAVRLVKSTRVPFHLMRYCKEDLLLLAFQEEERIYSEGVRGCYTKKGAFNYDKKKPKWDCPYKTVIVGVFHELSKMQYNVKQIVARELVEACLKHLGEEVPGLVHLNRQINTAVEKHTEYEVRLYEKRWMCDGVMYQGYKHPNYTKVLTEVTPAQVEAFVKLVLS